MIIDNLKSSARYEHMNPYFKKAFDYLKSLDFSKIEVGKVILDGENLIFNVSDSTLKTEENAKLEVHDKYIDIQMPVSKVEGFGWLHRSDLKQESAPFNTEKDIQFFEDKAQTYFDLQPGSFAIFFPDDAHAPCIGNGTIRKIVVKVKVA
ncbi:DUF386 domain-containing protein [Dysgonomonas sp. 216]|uniref:YhcH/YjgK/YiaL family protein n=1 Tax=Dysgonomonas sp. 216 TaxID=2302934 RepID=UPI0013D58512|nr:YhcH/YjgK/YiaL family protein [Dysgonomonas sp. 216]NDW17532.1 DUF386 domain-containing protein [Dysgonomonas sp. 216]